MCFLYYIGGIFGYYYYLYFLLDRISSSCAITLLIFLLGLVDHQFSTHSNYQIETRNVIQRTKFDIVSSPITPHLTFCLTVENMAASIRNPVIVIIGSTGTGKTKLSLELAKLFNGEIISADAMQVYFQTVNILRFRSVNMLHDSDKPLLAESDWVLSLSRSNLAWHCLQTKLCCLYLNKYLFQSTVCAICVIC